MEIKKPLDHQPIYIRMIDKITRYIVNNKERPSLCGSTISALYDDYIRCKNLYITYMKQISEIEELHESGTLTLENLQKII